MMNAERIGPKYSVALYDHEIEPSGDWSAELAERFIGQCVNLNRQQLAQAFRTLYAAGWSDVSVYVRLENELELKREAFRQWAEAVRDPAEEAAEGTRTIYARNGGAYAEYNIANLDTFWAFNTRFEYVGFMGASVPWAERQTREECLQAFIDRAKIFFEHETVDMSHLHKEARLDMIERLTPTGLFGFIEPSLNKE